MKWFEAIASQENCHRRFAALGTGDPHNETLVAVEEVAIVIVADHHYRFASEKA